MLLPFKDEWSRRNENVSVRFYTSVLI
jgi:hypothetical protein